MSLWGGRFKFEDTSVTHRDYNEPGEGIRANIPSYPPGVFVGKFGIVPSETTFRADFQIKERIANPAFKLKQNFRLPRPLVTVEYDQFPAAPAMSYDMSGGSHEDAMRCPEPLGPPEWPPLALPREWPPSAEPEWQLPAARQPYHHSSSLRVSGERKRLTSTYTEELGTVRPGEVAHFAPPPPGLLPCGYPQHHTEYVDQFSAQLIRPPGFHAYAAHLGKLRPARVSSQCPRWETSYCAMCRETLEAPSWVRDFLRSCPSPDPAPRHN